MEKFTLEELQALKDMMGGDYGSEAIESSINAANKRMDVTDAFKKADVEDMVKNISKPGKSAIDAAETLAPKQFPATIPGQRATAWQMPDVLHGNRKVLSTPNVIEMGDETAGKAIQPIYRKLSEETIEQTPSFMSRFAPKAAKFLKVAGPAAEVVGALTPDNAFAGEIQADKPLTQIAPNLYSQEGSQQLYTPETLEILRKQGYTIPAYGEPPAQPPQAQPPLAAEFPALPQQEQPIDVGQMGGASAGASKSSGFQMPYIAEPKANPLLAQMFTGTQEGSKEALEKALAERDSALTMANYGQLGTRLAASLSGKDPTAFDALAKEGFDAAKLPLENYAKRLENQKVDPKSSMSAQYRKALQSIGFNVPENASAADLEKVYPQAADIFRTLESAKERRAAMRENALIRAQAKHDADKDKGDYKKAQYIERASKSLDALSKNYAKTRQAANMAKSINPENAVQQVTGLYSLISTLDPGSVVREGEISLATSAGGLSGKVESVLSQLSANPKIINTKTIEDIKKEIERLAQGQEETYNNYRERTLNQGTQLYGVAPDEYGLIDPFYQDKKKKDSVQKYANDHFGGDYNKAEAFLKKRGDLK